MSIGSCSVAYGGRPVIICPNRLLERKQIFMDCIHLLSLHVPGNELHVIPEVQIPGGNVDFFLVSTDAKRNVKDFVGIELQTLDTTGTIWPEREKLLKEKGIVIKDKIENKSFGINWKMTAKTILLQLHHKIDTFEHLNKHLVLVTQDCLIDYIKKEFSFNHISANASIGNSMHIHSYSMQAEKDGFKIVLNSRYSTDSKGLSELLGLKTNPDLDFEEIAQSLKSRISDATMLQI